jgi:RNA polymerase sigma factor (sigma-70 family)
VPRGLIPFNGRNCCHTSGIVVRVVGVRDQEERESPTVGSFEVFYAEMRRPLAALAYAVCGSWSAADDLTQEALEVAFKDWERIRSLDNPEAWVKRILLNRSVSGRRRRAAERRARARMNGRSDVEAFPDLTGDFERIWAEVRHLPKRQVEVIALRYVEGLTVAEIAETLSLTKETINTHLRRARQTLSRRLDLEDES